MKKTVMIIGHPHWKESLSNKIILKTFLQKVADEKLNDQLEVRNLIDLYPEYKIDTKAEQEVLLEKETVVLQFPLHWYSTPAILKNLDR